MDFLVESSQVPIIFQLVLPSIFHQSDFTICFSKSNPSNLQKSKYFKKNGPFMPRPQHGS